MFIGPVCRSVWLFLAPRRFPAKTLFRERWISLDFLGFSRPNLDFSMSYADKTAEIFSGAMALALTPPQQRAPSWHVERQNCS
jgi:hypothetical protein